MSFGPTVGPEWGLFGEGLAQWIRRSRFQEAVKRNLQQIPWSACLLFSFHTIQIHIFNIQRPPIVILFRQCLDVLNETSFQPTGSIQNGAGYRNNVACPAQGEQERVHEQKFPQKSKVCSERVLPEN